MQYLIKIWKDNQVKCYSEAIFFFVPAKTGVSEMCDMFQHLEKMLQKFLMSKPKLKLSSNIFTKTKKERKIIPEPRNLPSCQESQMMRSLTTKIGK